MAEIKAKKVIFKNRDGEYLLPMTVSSLEIGDIGFTQMAIDETKGKRRKLNGQLIIQEQYVELTNIIKNSVALNPDLACTESEWQTAVTMSTAGICYKYVIDNGAGTIRLPKYPNYFIGGVNGVAPVVGNGLALGLTDGTSNASIYIRNMSNLGGSASMLLSKAGYGTTAGTVVAEDTSWGTNVKTTIGVTTDSTKSGIEAQIKQEQIKGTYFIQVATGAETEDNIINEIELNNPFSLLDYKYSEYELNNISWLRSQGQFNSKAIYPAVYDLLLKIYNGTETKVGVSVKLSTGSYTDYDFVLNTANETFRLPIKVKQNFYDNIAPVVGNGLALGLNTSNGNNGLIIANNYLTVGKNAFGAVAGNVVSPTDEYPAQLSSIGVTTNGTKSGIEAHLTENTDLYLYFYVGETVQNANLINAGRIEEKLVDKVDRSEMREVPCIVETYVNGGSGYRLWSDGFGMQWGNTGSNANTITYLRNFRDTNYNIQFSPEGSVNYQTVKSRTVDGFVLNGSQSIQNWMCFGYFEV